MATKITQLLLPQMFAARRGSDPKIDRHKRPHLLKTYLTAVILLFNMAFIGSINAQPTRSGALDLSYQEGDAMIIPVFTPSILSAESLCNTPFTIEMWVEMVSNPGSDMVLFKLDGGPYKVSLGWMTDHFLLEAEGGALNGAYWEFYDITQFPDLIGKWNHLAFSYDGNSRIEIYLNGERIYHTYLAINQSEITNLFPGINPTLYIGGHQLRDTRIGKMNVGEVRVWRTMLPFDNIKEYYNQEINPSHPYWNKLYRYYQCTDHTISNNTVHIPSVINDKLGYNADAGVTNNLLNRVKNDMYPPIYPPRFNNSTFNVSTNATDCGENQIEVTWSDFEDKNAYNYILHQEVNYELVRSDNESLVLYDGQDNTFLDTDVSGGDKYRYKLKAYYTINGVKYYSKDELWSDFGTVKYQYDAPTLTATTDNCDGTITLNWSSDYTPPAWTLQRSNTSDFSSGVLTINSSIGGSETEYTDIPPTTNSNYYYKVIATGYDNNGCSVNGTYSAIANGFSANIPTAPADITLAPNTGAGEITVSWTAVDANATSWIVRRTDEDGSNPVDFTGITSTGYTDATVSACQVYKYSVGAVNSCSTGDFFETKSAAIGNSDLDNKIVYIEASKGYYGDGVQLNWGINGSYSTIDGFIIERSESGENNYQIIASLDNLQTLYKDQTALGGVLYDYRIQATADCLGNLVYSNDATDLGFTIPFGVANGHVEYEGGNAVENVKVNIEPKNGMGGKSLYFDGVDDKVTIDNFNGVEGAAPRTIECWVKLPTANNNFNILGTHEIDSFSQNFLLSVTGLGKPMVTLGSSYGYIIYNQNLFDNQWHHVAIVVPDEAQYSGDIKCYIDGVECSIDPVSCISCEINTPASTELNIGGNYAALSYFNGYLDEIRYWDVARTNDEIKKSYGRLLNGNEDGLIGYWRCDEGVGNKIYDASKTGSTFNKHDGVFVNGVNWTDETPSGDQLSLAAITDQYGDYSADYIPFRQGGELYRVTPGLGVHEFSPNSRTIYLGDGDATQNNLDFTDISSFDVSGKVTYYNSTFPVQGVQVLIDGAPAVGAGKNIVTTDATGHFTVNVPIGYHYISVEKDGHVFSSGYFPPKNASGGFNFHEFNDDLSGIEFIDSTLVKVLGRVAGGTVEGDKEVGFGLSTNNVGVADIIFKAQNEAYDLDTADAAIFSIKTLQTDASTGEFEIYLIPEKFEIQKAGNDTYSIDVNDLSTLDLSNSLTATTVYDSTLVESANGNYYRVDTAWYHHKLNFVIRETPNVEITDLNGNNFVGDTVIYFTNQLTGLADTLDLTSNNPYLHPILQMGKTYTANVFVYEEYSNPSHPDGAVVDKVPVNNARLTIDNQLEITESGTTASTDEKGYYQYSFKAGVPSITQDQLVPENSYTKLMQVYATTDKITVEWREANPFRGYILGAFPIEGTDFVTYGYEVPEIVLRDPPGSNSYAYIEQGSEFSRTTSWELNFDVNTGIDNTVHSGAKLGFGGGLAGPLIESEIVSDSQLGLQITRSTDNEGKYKETTSFNRRIETSSDPEDVGSDADLYIGHAYNAYFTKSKNLRLLPEQYCIDNNLDYIEVPGAELVLGILDGLVMDQGNTSTYFVYSQKHILGELIPNLIVMRDNLLAGDKYESHIPRTSPYYGLNNDDKSLEKLISDSLKMNPSFDVATASYAFMGEPTENDSVQFFNDQITYWMNAIAMNEAEKINAETFNNISIDGTAGAYSESVSQSFNSAFNWKSSRQLKFKWNSEFSTIYTGNGYTGNSIFNISAEIANGTNESEQNKVTFGYVIDERDEGDYYSIDIKREQGVPVYSYDSFTESVTSQEEFLENQATVAGVGAGTLIGSTAISTISTKLAGKSNYWASVATFGVDVAIFAGELGNMLYNTFSTYENMDGNTTWDVSGFDISSPIFSIRGGQSKCPYEGEQYSIFALDAQKNLAKLHTGTLQREVPVIDVEKALITNVPENSKASFVLKLQNHSASNTDNWYALSIDESTNPYGAILKIDGNSPEKEYLVPAWGTLTKTLTVQMGQPEVFEYDSIGIILHSACQWDPTNVQNDIADTVYISAHFAPTCTPVDIKGMQDNWVLNYDDNGEMGVTLTDYDVNFSTLEKLQFQYKTLTGNPISTIAYFAEEGTAYNEYSGPKALLSGSAEESFTWDVSSMNDRTYLIRARSTCTDGSYAESDWYTGLIDSKPPKVFGKPEPGDGILSAGEVISIRFDESLEQGIITENNFSITGVLNGSEISHNTSLHFDGINDYTSVNNGVVLTDKSFSIEFWLRRNAQSGSVLLSQGENTASNLELGFDASNQLYLTVNGENFTGDATTAYSTTNPWNSWHHYGVVYNHSDKTLSMYADDQTIFTQSDVNLEYSTTGKLFIGKSATSTGNHFSGNMHELRIWDDARTFGELYSNMYKSLSGREAGAYRNWEMNEGNGTIIADKVRNQVMEVNAQWAIEPAGKAVDFNGSQYLELKGTNATIDDETDMTIEFWFKAATPSAPATLFSNGKGDGIEVPGVKNPVNALSITAQTDGSIVVNSGGYAFEAVTNNFMDDNWHHFALVVDRNSNTKAFIDSELQNSTSSDSIAQFANARIFVGARGWNIDPANYTFDQYFTGQMDEIRIWNTARTADQIELYHQTKLGGEEFGLAGYYPFEYYQTVMGVQVLTETWEDQWINELGANNGAAIPHGSMVITDVAPEIKDARPVQKVSFDYVVNDDEIILTPTLSSEKLENTILEISIKDVYDLNGNRLLSPVNWTAYIDQNQVVWNESTVSLEKEIYEPKSFTTSIVNLGGTSKEYTLSNLPDWLTTSFTSGVIEPDEELEITFDINEATNLGEYDNTIYLSTDFGFNEALNVKLRVYIPEPEWTVNPADYENSMIVVGQLNIAGNYSADVYDKIAAFAGDECRGVANVQYNKNRDAYYVFLTVYSNSTTEDLTYKVWDASAGEVYTDVTPEINFESNQLTGSIGNPTLFECGYLLNSSIDLNQGWKWISFNRTMDNYSDVNTLFAKLTLGDGDIIKTKTAYAIYDSGFDFWLSSGLTPQAGEMYKIKLSQANTLDYEGQFIDANNHPITINSGWNRMGYIPQTNIEINQALAGYNAQEGDVLKAQTRFALYDGSEWFGSLSYLKPGEGYMLWSQTTTPVQFTYPNKSTLGNLKSGVKEEQLISYFSGNNVNPFTYPGSVSITAHLNNVNNLPEGVQVGAFINEELRGVGTLNKQSVDLSEFTMITAFGDEVDNGSEIQFALLSGGDVYELKGSTIFLNDNFQGNLSLPVELYLDESDMNDMDNHFNVYPNPFKNKVNINFFLPEESKVVIDLYNLSGSKVGEWMSNELEAGTQTITRYFGELPTGVYFIKLQVGEKVYEQKLIKQQ